MCLIPQFIEEGKEGVVTSIQECILSCEASQLCSYPTIHFSQRTHGRGMGRSGSMDSYPFLLGTYTNNA